MTQKSSGRAEHFNFPVSANCVLISFFRLILKSADVGVAMGSMGSDIAVEAADIALMSDDIAKLPYLKPLSNATVKTIKISIALSMCINFLAVTLSVLGVLNPTTGALVHNAGSCLVVLIAALLYDRKFDK